ncbi:MAG: hypothetical protein R3E60_00775 [Alphaproteobacteria bacterium]
MHDAEYVIGPAGLQSVKWLKIKGNRLAQIQGGNAALPGRTVAPPSRNTVFLFTAAATQNRHCNPYAPQ